MKFLADCLLKGVLASVLRAGGYAFAGYCAYMALYCLVWGR